MSHDWMYTQDVFIDIHEELYPYSKVLEFFKVVERDFDVKKYCNGSNAGGRWIFQIYSEEFILEISDTIQKHIQIEGNHPIAEVMSGDGRLTEFIRTRLDCDIITTDAKTGRYNIAYPKWVEKKTAIETVEEYDPALVIISWEPYLSMAGIELVKMGIPLMWIGNPEMCGHEELFEFDFWSLNSKFAISRHDSFLSQERKTDVFVFNVDKRLNCSV
ncbi:MAG: hypothetical protein GF411_02345 [Candidatus Lokiarchaeota archaeon]|nr:hypothetical protein [Candidatus Lokiarchaeota archaeon]